MTRQQIIAAIREAYPGFRAPDYAKAHNPDYYGIELTAGAKAIERSCVPSRRRVRVEIHRKLTWRAARPLFDRVEAAKAKTGISTTQELITVAVMKYLDEVER